MFVMKIMNIIANSVETRKTGRLTGTPTRRQIVRDASLFSKL